MSTTSQAILCMCMGIISFCFAQIISVSQIVTLIKTKNTSGVSVWTYLIFVIAGAMCLAWGFSAYYKYTYQYLYDNPNVNMFLVQWQFIPIIAYYITDFCLSLTMLTIKSRHMIMAKKLGINEIELADYLNKKQQKKFIASGKKFYASKIFPAFILLLILFSAIIVFIVCFTLFSAPTVGKDTESWNFVMVLSLLAAILWEAISWPQFITSLRFKDTTGISMNWAIFMPIGLTFSFLYALVMGLTLGDGSFSYDTIGALVFNGMIVNYGVLFLKIRNRKAAKKLHMTEVEYTKKILIPAAKKKQLAKAKKGK